MKTVRINEGDARLIDFNDANIRFIARPNELFIVSLINEEGNYCYGELDLAQTQYLLGYLQDVISDIKS